MRVVIADDSGPMREKAQLVLKQLGWEIVAVCKDGLEAWAAIEELQPDLAWLDYTMPNMSGAQVAQSIAENDIPTKVILVTANGQQGAAYNPDLKTASVIIKPYNKTLARIHLAKVFGEDCCDG